MTVMTYVEVAAVDREGALRELDSGDEERVTDALLGLSLHDDDYVWVERLIAQHIAAGSSVLVRRTAAICVSHVVRRSRNLSCESVVSILKAMLQEPELAGVAQDALDDIEIYLEPEK